jgi:hypothetical protein
MNHNTPTIEIVKSKVLPNFVIRANGVVLDSCKSRKDALMLKRWFEQQLHYIPKKPYESWREWEGRITHLRPQTYAYIKSTCRGKEVVKLVKG